MEEDKERSGSFGVRGTENDSPEKFAVRGQIPDINIVREAEMLRTLGYPGLVKGYEIGLPPSQDEPTSVLMALM
jgi:hypothetical protein